MRVTTRAALTIVRTAIGRPLTPRVSLWLGPKLQGDLRRNGHVIRGVVNLTVPRRSS